jgi:hypothetical protein
MAQFGYGQEILEQAYKYAIFSGYDKFKADNGWLENLYQKIVNVIDQTSYKNDYLYLIK